MSRRASRTRTDNDPDREDRHRQRVALTWLVGLLVAMLLWWWLVITLTR